MARFAGVLNRLEKDIENYKASIDRQTKDLETARQEVNKPFERETELQEALAGQKKITYDYEHYNEVKDKYEGAVTNDNTDINNATSYDLASTATYQNYTYKALTEKKDMSVTLLDTESVRDENGNINRADVVNKGIENVRKKNNAKNTTENAYVYIPDIDRNVLVGKRGLSHGLTRNAEATAFVTTKIGDVLENAIKVNELNPRQNEVGAYVLLGIAMNKNKNYYPVRVVISQYSVVEEVEVLDALYAINAKKKNQSSNEAELPASAVPPIKGSSTISISNLLELVNGEFSDVLTNDVLDNLGVNRKKSTLSEGIKYTKEDTISYDLNLQTRKQGKRVKYIPYCKVRYADINAIHKQLYKLYAGVDSAFADGIAIEVENTVYIIDSGKENGKISFGIRKYSKIKDDELRKEWVKKINDNGISEGYIHRELLGKFGVQSGYNIGRNMRREFGSELPIDKEKPTDNEERVSRNHWDRGVSILEDTISYDLNLQTRKQGKRVKYIPYSKVRYADINAIKKQLYKIYSDVRDGFADGIALEVGNAIYVVDSGKENGEITFGIRKKIKVSNAEIIKERCAKINDNAISEGYVGSELVGKIKIESNNDNRSSIGREFGSELSIDKEKPTDNEERVSRNNGDRGVSILEDADGTENQRGKVKQMIELRMKDGEPAKEATSTTWKTQHFVQQVRRIP